MRRGFTLIEMLILVALTALLVAMMLPGLSRTRQVARTIECRSNLRQIAMLHVDPTGDGRWGNSPYDIDSANGEVFDGASKGSGGDSHRVRQRRKGLGEGRGGGGQIGNEGQSFQEFMEETAEDQTRYWLLICPDGLQFNRNSYGMRWEVRETLVERFATSRDVIFGCSDYKVVDVVREFALRHTGQATFLFGDLHVSGHGLEIFSTQDISRRSDREEADPLPF